MKKRKANKYIDLCLYLFTYLTINTLGVSPQLLNSLGRGNPSSPGVVQKGRQHNRDPPPPRQRDCVEETAACAAQAHSRQSGHKATEPPRHPVRVCLFLLLLHSSPVGTQFQELQVLEVHIQLACAHRVIHIFCIRGRSYHPRPS